VTGYRSIEEAKRHIASYINGYYSQARPHQTNDGMTPNKAEELYFDSSKSATNIT